MDKFKVLVMFVLFPVIILSLPFVALFYKEGGKGKQNGFDKGLI